MQAAAYSILLVQVAIARYLGIRPSEVRARHRLRDDLGLDAFDVALVAVAIGDQLGVEVSLEDVDDAATVNAFARCITEALHVDVTADDDVLSVRDCTIDHVSSPLSGADDR
jgi:acyl carrier protein